MMRRGSTSKLGQPSRRRQEWSRLVTIVGLVMLFAMLPATLLAQNTGQILGRVTDSTGSVVVGAQVTGEMRGTGLTRTATTNGDGDYSLPALPIGTYTVSVEASGFKKFENTNVTVDAGINVHLDASLVPGTVKEEITVSADATQVNTTNATLSTTIPQEMVEELPLAGGNVIGLAITLPGVTDVNAPTLFTGDRSGPTFNASGARSSSNLLLLDGVMHNSLFRGTGQNYPPKDALAQVEYLSNQYGAMYGHFNGAITNVVTKSGTNQFHGTMYEYAQNSVFNASNWYTQVTPAVHQNQFGTTITGPVLKDRLFFTLAYEGIRQGNQGVSSGAVTPTADETLGNLSADAPLDKTTGLPKVDTYLTNPNWSGGKYYSSLAPLLSPTCAAALGTGQYIIGSKIPSVCLNPVSQAIIQKYLPPVGPDGTLVQLYPNPAGANTGFGRLDLHFGKHTLDGRYDILQSNQMGHNTNGTNVASYEAMNQNARNQVISINDTYMVSPNMVNVVRVGYNRMFFLQTPADSTNLASLGANFPNDPADLPAIQVSSLFTLGGTSTAAQRCINQSFDFMEQLSYTHGKHQLQFGAELLRMQYLNRAYFQMQGNLSFNNSMYTGSALGDFLFGLASTSSGETPASSRAASSQITRSMRRTTGRFFRV